MRRLHPLMRRGAVLIATALLGALTASTALGQEAWWHLNTATQPTNLPSGKTRTQVEELNVTATGGSYYLASTRYGNYQTFTPVPYNASAELLQELIEQAIFPGRKVSVTGGPNATGAKYTINFPGQSFPEQSIALVTLAFGLQGEVSVKEVSSGAIDGRIALIAANLGDGSINLAHNAVKIADTLPPGFEAVEIEGNSQIDGDQGPGPLECAIKTMTCTLVGETPNGSTGVPEPKFLPPFVNIQVEITVVVKAGASGENEVNVSGGENAQSHSEVLGASLRSPLAQSDQPTPVGVETYELTPEEEGGTIDRQAGSHPFQLTTTLALNKQASGDPVAMAKDLAFRLPPGLIGNPTPFPRCTLAEFLSESGCPQRTVVGAASVGVDEPAHGGIQTFNSPIYTLEPSTGEPARFGFIAGVVPVYLDTSVRTGEDYGVTVSVQNITQLAAFISSQVTFWGVPGDPRHDNTRGDTCLGDLLKPERGSAGCNPLDQHEPPPLLQMPGSCTGRPLQTTVETDTWASEGSFRGLGAEVPPLVGCNRLPFTPSIIVTPDGKAADTPTGLAVDVHVPQAASLNPEGLAEAEVQNTTVTLPAGVAINPAGGDGLLACSESQLALHADTLPGCAEASKVGTVEVTTPLLPNPLRGAAYLADQDENPFGSLVALYLVFRDPVSGTLVKVAGEVKLDETTGQLVSTFKETPQLPFEDLVLHFFGGSRAPLSTPSFCGNYTTTASISPWSGNPPAKSSSTFEISSGPNGSPCQDPLPFAPSFTAQTTSIQAGGFSPFSMTMSREDGSQNLDAITLHMPPGVSGMLTGVKLCDEADADAGTCGPESQIGETIVSVGVGGDPFTVVGGKVYLTGPYAGAPYGLSIVNPAKAGPFDLEKTRLHSPACDCLVVRAKIEVDPTTAALTVTTDTTGPYRIPTILEGVPLQIKHVNVTIDRPSFIFNPTNCSKMAITGNLTSSEGAADQLSVPFQATNCAVLGFKPQFSVSTTAHHTRTDGTSLDVKLTYPKARFGSQANIAKVRVELPRQLPSRLTTLQKACTDTVFNANPENCPPASKVGEAIATTPIIPEDFRGPAYFVSHGGVKFPELIIALHGYALTVDLHGETFISKAGITSTTFSTVPDVPIGTFELKLPAGPDSALAANGDLCASKLTMPTTFSAQNGAFIKQDTPIHVVGCAPEIRVIRHSVKGKHAMVVVSVPSAGMLVADGGGVHRSARRVAQAGTVTLTLRLSKTEQSFLAHHHGRRLQVPITLSFVPGHGARLQARVAVLMR